MDFKTRQGTTADEAWLYELYCTTMRTYIEKTWGWDEAFQKHEFKTNLHPTRFKIVIVRGNDVGAYLISEAPDHYWLKMLIITPEMQKHGLGTEIVRKLQAESERSGKQLKLSVLRVNPAKELYSRLGFQIYDEDESSYKMVWAYNKPIQPTQKARG